MEGLKVEHWHQWEKLCCYFMSEIAEQSFGAETAYITYGTRGQSQFGIDLVPSCSDLPVVGQCKLTSGSFTWDMVLAEVAKTDKYSNEIGFYMLFTTANRHTSVDDQRNGKDYPYYHTRPSGKRFRVEVKYWSEIPDIDMVPMSVRQELFPDAFRIAAPIKKDGPSSNSYLSSLIAMKKHIPTIITQRHLAWLETWDFSCGFVNEVDFNPFSALFLEHDRTASALTYSIHEWLHASGRAELAACMPAAERFFIALSEFKNSITAQTIGQGPMNFGVLSLNGLDRSAWPKITRDWKSKADELVSIYRHDVLGEQAF